MWGASDVAPRSRRQGHAKHRTLRGPHSPGTRCALLYFAWLCFALLCWLAGWLADARVIAQSASTSFLRQGQRGVQAVEPALPRGRTLVSASPSSPGECTSREHMRSTEVPAQWRGTVAVAVAVCLMPSLVDATQLYISYGAATTTTAAATALMPSTDARTQR